MSSFRWREIATHTAAALIGGYAVMTSGQLSGTSSRANDPPSCANDPPACANDPAVARARASLDAAARSPCAALGLPPAESHRVTPVFVSGTDSSRRVPRWVLQRLGRGMDRVRRGENEVRRDENGVRREGDGGVADRRRGEDDGKNAKHAEDARDAKDGTDVKDGKNAENAKNAKNAKNAENAENAENAKNAENEKSRGGGSSGRKNERRHVARANRAESEFFEDPEADAALRATLEDYRGSGFDRGHMAPAADASRLSQADMDATFTLANMCPQHPELNRKYWARLESLVRKLGRKHDDVFVLSGPLFIPRVELGGEARGRGKWRVEHEVIGASVPPAVHVPTHFFKAVLVRDGDAGNTRFADGDRAISDARIAAWIVPNGPIPEGEPLGSFEVPLDALERLLGFRVFPLAVQDRVGQVLARLCDEPGKCDLPKPWSFNNNNSNNSGGNNGSNGAGKGKAKAPRTD